MVMLLMFFFFEYLGIFWGLVPFKLIEKYFSSDWIFPDNLMFLIKFFSAYNTLCLNLNDVKSEILFSSAILLKLKPSNKLSIILLHISNDNLLWQTIVSVVSDEVNLQPLQIYFWIPVLVLPFLWSLHPHFLQYSSLFLKFKITLELEFFLEHKLDKFSTK